MIASRLIVVAILICSPASSALAEPEQPPTSQGIAPLIEFCREVVLPSDPLANLGECISFGTTFGGPGFPAHYCHYLRDNGILEELEITYAECIRE